MATCADLTAEFSQRHLSRYIMRNSKNDLSGAGNEVLSNQTVSARRWEITWHFALAVNDVVPIL